MLLLMWGGSAEAIRTSYAYKNASLAQAEDESKISLSARFAENLRSESERLKRRHNQVVQLPCQHTRTPALIPKNHNIHLFLRIVIKAAADAIFFTGMSPPHNNF